MGKRYNSVTEMIKDTSSSEEFSDKVLSEIGERSISKFLFASRCKHNLTQKDLAEKIGCTQGRISKIESSYNGEISVKDLLDYGKALNLQLEIGYRTPSTKIVDLIKYHAFKIKNYLNQLTTLAKDDRDLNRAIDMFHKEVLLNMSKIIATSALNLDVHRHRIYRKDQIHFSSPLSKEKLEEIQKKTVSV